MSRSLRVRADLVPQVELSVKRNGFLRKKDLAEALDMAESTVRKFRRGKPVDYAIFVEICQKLNLEWKEFADLGEVAKFEQESKEAVALSESELSSKPIVLDQSQLRNPLPDKKQNTLEVSHKIEANSIRECFSKSIDQLGSDKLYVRIGAIYALEKIANDSTTEHWTIMEYLAAFVRNAPRRKEEEGIPDDIQAALTVIGRRNSKKDPENQRLDLSNIDIRGAILIGANLQGAILSKANLQGTDLRDAKLQGADLTKANLKRAKLWGAELEKAKLQEANLERAVLNGAELQGAILDHANLEYAYLWYVKLQQAQLYNTNLEGAILKEAQLQGASLDGANLKGAFLNRADLEGVSLEVAYLEGADLSEARNLKSLQIGQAFGDNTTVLPNDIAIPVHWI